MIISMTEDLMKKGGETTETCINMYMDEYIIKKKR